MSALIRSSHSLNIIGGSAYVFGGDGRDGDGLDNDMHVVRLPLSGASSDYYRIKAAASEPKNTVETTSAAAAATKEDVEAAKPEEAPKSDDEDAGPTGEGDDATKSEEKLADASLDSITLESPIATKDKGKGLALQSFPPTATVPSPRTGHATAIIGSRIFMFGGRSSSGPLNESGRVWVFDTRSNTWSFLDPVPAVTGGNIVPHPSPRSHHCSASSDRPQAIPPGPPPKRAETWKEWALGDTSRTGIPQDPVVGYVAEHAVDEHSRDFGTFFVHGGLLADGTRGNDLWSFDVFSRRWTELPAAPGPGRSGAAIAVHDDRVYRFGGFDGAAEVGGQLDYLDLETETFEEGPVMTEGAVRPKTGWQAILQEAVVEDGSLIAPAWPSPRSVSSMQVVPIPGGSNYLVVSFGETNPAAGETSAKVLDDIWVYRLAPAKGVNTANITAAFMSAIGRKQDESKWVRVPVAPYEPEEDRSLPRARGWLASAPITDLEESGILIWGGRGEGDSRLGDGWILRLSE